MQETIFVGLAFCWLGALGRAEVIVVDPAGGGQFTEIQPALEAAQAGDTVLVKPGEYLLAEPIAFLQRAVTLRSEAGAKQTILREAELPARRSPTPVVLFAEPASGAGIDGFTITKGSFGGVYIQGAREEPGPLIRRCNIQGNHAYGVYCEQSEARFVDCKIADNDGSGLYCGESRPFLVRCTISGNQAGEAGDGISGDHGIVTLTDCRITANKRCGILLHEAGSANLLRCEVSGNHLAMFAGWLSGATFVNSRVTGNAGGGVMSGPEGALDLTNSTVAENGGDGVIFQSESKNTVRNCIVWGNPVSINAEPEILVTHSIVEGAGVFPGEGNGNSDPLFVGPGDFRLQAGSPAIDSGIPDGAPTTDIEGYTRPCGAGVDMGAHEAGGCLPQARAALADPPDPVVRVNIAVACASVLTFPGGEEDWTLDAAAFRNLGPGDAATLIVGARLYADDGDGKFTGGQDTLVSSVAHFDATVQTVVFGDLEHAGPPGSQMTFFLVCELARAHPTAGALDENRPRSGHEDGGGAGPWSHVEPLLALCGLALLLPAVMGRRLIRRLVPGLFLLACAGFVSMISCSDGSGSHHRATPEARQLQMELSSLDVHGSPGLKIQVSGLPLQAWTFDA
jgi:hypothetical protein